MVSCWDLTVSGPRVMELGRVRDAPRGASPSASGEGWMQAGCSGYTDPAAQEHQTLLSTWGWGQDYSRTQLWRGREGKGSTKPDHERLPGGLGTLRPLQAALSGFATDFSPLGDREQLQAAC